MNFDTLHQEIVNSTGIIHAVLAGLSQDEAKFKPSAEAWSILEVVCHLYDEEREDFREHLDFILHRQGEEWHRIDPQGWVTTRKYNERDFIEAQEKFFAERKESLDWLRNLSKVDWDISFKSQVGHMPAGEMLASWIAHDNLHIRQLVELRRARIENITQPYAIAYAGDW